MHMHPAAIGLQPISSYAAGNERAAAAQRAAETRKRLLRSAQSIEGQATTDPDATLLIGQWLDSRHSQVLAGDEYHAAAEGKDPDLG
ncbi:MAG: hypothetical protein WAL45_06480 [Terracidiphilus sp.]